MIKNNNNIYEFIIWSNTLWCKNRIVDDLNKNFEIVSKFYVAWEEEKFDKNLISFYGTKMPDLEEKIKITGKKPFYIIVVKDKNPQYKKRITCGIEETVNANIYDKKNEYRNLTARNFRIHSSCNENETKHDLTVLFGNDCYNFLSKQIDDGTVFINTKSLEGFSSIDDFKECIKNFNGSITYVKEGEIIIFTKCRIDLICFLQCEKISRFQYKIKINNREILLNIYGEDENDLPIGFMNKKECFEDFYINNKQYNCFLLNNKIDKQLNNFFKKYSFDINREEIDTMRAKINISIFDRIKDKIKLLIAKTNNVLYKIGNK